MAQYAAKLLFRFRPVGAVNGHQRYLCEERIVTFRAATSRAALAKTKRLARKSSYSYPVVGGGRVRFESVGIMELMELGVEAGPGEVWWDIYMRKLSGRRTRLLPAEHQLRIFTDRAPRAQNPKRGSSQDAPPNKRLKPPGAHK